MAQGHSCRRAQLGFAVQGPCGGAALGMVGKLPSRSGCRWEGGGQLEVLTRRLAGLGVPPALPSINGATQLRN